MSDNIQEKLKLLEEKYEAMGQDMASYLDGLYYSDNLTYWDYIHLDTLLSLQTPRTAMADEQIFIMYHQICELFFKLILHELKQIANMDLLDEATFIEKIKRAHRYFTHLTSSFDVMTDGMDRTQFLKYRMSLLPASGFQSVQYRSIEFHCTDVVNLTGVNKQNTNNNLTHDFELLYWKNGATELATGKKTLTLRQFEDKYQRKLMRLVERYQHKNVWQKFKQIPNPSPELKEALRALDVAANISWILAHYRSAAKYLQANSDTIKATGGTNWVQYLPPKFQRVQFFPELWTAAELENWGKNWVEEIMA